MTKPLVNAAVIDHGPQLINHRYCRAHHTTILIDISRCKFVRMEIKIRFADHLSFLIHTKTR